MAFLKFIDKRGAESFVSGIAQFGRVKIYSEMEQKQCYGRPDEFENKFYTTKYQMPNGGSIGLCITPNRENMNYALCLYHLDNKHDVSRITEMFEFGDYVVKIEDEEAFDRRIQREVEKSRRMLYAGDVVYYQDNSIEDEMRVMDLMTKGLDYISFVKRKEIFSYQNEYRYLIVDESEKRDKIQIHVGNLEDIATIMSKSEFLKTL
ncbi:MAG: hypothetical protein KH449_10660 [Lachnospiraceae bacterium]|nr:hypothetical protein [Lachnospiraceae bacterium]